jgi:hypothetical protein
MAKKMGRPTIDPKGRPQGKVCQIRLSDAERADYGQAAQKADLGLSAWMRDRLSKAAKRELGK